MPPRLDTTTEATWDRPTRRNPVSWPEYATVSSGDVPVALCGTDVATGIGQVVGTGAAVVGGAMVVATVVVGNIVVGSIVVVGSAVVDGAVVVDAVVVVDSTSGAGVVGTARTVVDDADAEVVVASGGSATSSATSSVTRRSAPPDRTSPTANPATAVAAAPA